MIIYNGKWKVYCHIFPNNKIYIGITSSSLDSRWRKGEGYKTQFVYLAIKKFGWENIQHILIANNLTEQEAKNFEKLLIEKTKANFSDYGYNISDGGDTLKSTVNYEKTKELWNKGFSYLEIAKELNLDKRTIQCYLTRLGIIEKEKKQRTELFRQQEKEKIYQMYLNGDSINQIHLKLKHTRPYIKKVLIEKGIPSDYIIKQGSIRWKNRTKGGQDARN